MPLATAFDQLRAYLGERAEFTDQQLDVVQAAFLVRSLRTGEFLQRAGDVPRYAAFVAFGCLRSYVIDAKGKEHIVQFAPETWWLADNPSIATGSPSQYFYDAVEDSELLLVDRPSHDRIVHDVPPYAEAFRNGLQRHSAAKDHRIVSNLSASAEERYHEFLKTYPSLAARVPQWMLASYLGVSPETVSRIRAKRSRR